MMTAKSSKKVGVIIVNYKGNEDTYECLESLLESEYEELRIYLVDNGSGNISQKELADFCKNKEKIVFIPLSENRGFSGGNNVGINIAIGDGCKYILLLNNDTIVEKGFMQPLIETALNNKNNAVVTGKIKFFSEKNKIWFAGGHYNSLSGKTEHFGYGCEDSIYVDGSKKINFSTGCFMLLPVEVIKTIGMLPEHYFLYYEDNEYSLRILKNGFSIIYIPDSIIYHKVSSSTKKYKGITQYYMIRNSLQICREYNRGFVKYISYALVSMRSIKRVFEKKYNYRLVKKAYADFAKKRLGEQIK